MSHSGGAHGVGVAPGPRSSGLWEAQGAVGLTHRAADRLILIFLIFTDSVTACFYVCFIPFFKKHLNFFIWASSAFFTVNTQFKLTCGGCAIPILLYHSCLSPQPQRSPFLLLEHPRYSWAPGISLCWFWRAALGS